MNGILAGKQAGLQSENVESQNMASEPEGESQGDDQEGYERVVLAGIKILHDDSTSQPIIDMLKAGVDNPGRALATVATQIIVQIDEKSGGQIPEDFIVPASEEILESVMDFAVAANVFEITPEIQKQAEQEMVKLLSDNYGPPDEEDLVSYGEEEIDKAVRPFGVEDNG